MKCVAVSSIVVRYSEGPLFRKINRRLRLDVLLTLTQNLPYSLNPKPGASPQNTPLELASFVFRSSLTDLRIAGRYRFFICISAQSHVHTKFKTCHLNFRAEMLNRVQPTNPCERGKIATRTTMKWMAIKDDNDDDLLHSTLTVLARLWLFVLRLMLCSWCLDYFPFANHDQSCGPMHE